MICLILIVSAAGLSALAEPRGMSPVDFLEAPRLSDPSLSPDGRHLAYFRSETVWRENKIIDQLILTDLETGDILPGPDFGGALKDASRIWWHPQAGSFIYLKPVGDADIEQAFLYDLAKHESRQLTRHGGPVTGIVWRPDASGFFFIAAQEQPARDTELLSDGWVISPFESNANREIWSFDLATQTSEPVIGGRISVRDVSLSRDGRYLLYSRVPDHKLDSIHAGELVVLNIETGEHLRWTGNQNSEASAQLSPDGSRLAYIASVDETGAPYFEPKVFIAEPDKPARRLFGGLAMEALSLAWDQTGQGLYILANTGLETNLYHYSLNANVLSPLTNGQHSFRDWIYSPETDTHLARIATQDNPGEIHLMDDLATGFRPVTEVYADWPERFRLPKQDRVSWRGRRGVTIEGLLVYPIDYEPGQAYPLVTVIHGGPRTSTRFGSWHRSRYVSVLAAQGYMVLLPNHRGSSGYGDAFVRDMFGAYFRNAHHDVMDGIDALVDRGLADPDQLIAMGWSAGGHMVNKLITHTDRFAAASSGAGASEWRSMQGESDARFERQFVFGGEPWDRRPPTRRYNRDSPLNEAWKVTTPTLFFVGEKDVRVPPTQSILMYRAVEATGTPTVLFQAEDEPHNFRKPANQLFKINTELDWFARFTRNGRVDPVLPPDAYEVPDAPPAIAAPGADPSETTSP